MPDDPTVTTLPPKPPKKGKPKKGKPCTEITAPDGAVYVVDGVPYLAVPSGYVVTDQRTRKAPFGRRLLGGGQ